MIATPCSDIDSVENGDLCDAVWGTGQHELRDLAPPKGEQRALVPGLTRLGASRPGLTPTRRFRASGTRHMAEHRRIWPLLVYGGLAAIAAVSRKDTELSRPEPQAMARSANRTGRSIPRLTRAARPPAHPVRRRQVDSDKRPQEQVENDQPISVQMRRAKEPGRGRHAVAPWHIPWAGWKDILWRVYASVNDNRLLAVAAGVVFFSLLAIFPAIAAFVSLYGLVADASTIDSHLSLAAGVFPAGAVDILHEQITRLTAKSDAKLGFGFVTGLARRALERQRRHEGDHRRAERRL